MSDTPKTDAALDEYQQYGYGSYVDVEFARRLELELIAIEKKSRRDMFAAAALTGLLANYGWERTPKEADALELAAKAALFADDIIAELDKTP